MKRINPSSLYHSDTTSIRSFKFKAGLICLLSILINHFAVAQSTVQQPKLQDRIRAVENNLTENIQLNDAKPMNLQQRMNFYKIKGLSLAVIKNYKIDFVKSYGMADSALGTAVSARTLFQAASISKSLNGLALLKLFKDRNLDVNANINDYLKSWKFPYDSLAKGKQITLLNLLSHTAGLSTSGFAGYEIGKPLPSITQILNGESPANSDPVRSKFAPGMRQQYSGGGVTISQRILTDLTGEPYEKYLTEQVLKPLGMTYSTFAQPPKSTQKILLATGYDTGGKQIPGKYHIYPEQAAAGLWTNPTDLAKYIIETQLAYIGKSSKVLDQQNTQLRLNPYLSQASSALGVFIENNDGIKYFYHGGGNEGFRCVYYGSLEGGNGLVVMVNSDNGEIIQELTNSISSVYGFTGLNKSRKVKLVEVSDEDLDKYLGKYQLTPQLVLTVSREGKRIYAQATGESRLEVFPESNTKFFYKVIEATMEFVKDEQGAVKEMIFTQGQTIHAKKL